MRLRSLLFAIVCFFHSSWLWAEIKNYGIPIVYYTPETRTAIGGMLIQNFQDGPIGKSSSVRYAIAYTQNSQSILNIAPYFYYHHLKTEVFGSLYLSDFPTSYYESENVKKKYKENNFVVSIGAKRSLFTSINNIKMKLQLHKDIRDITEWNSTDEIQRFISNGDNHLDVVGLESGFEWDTRNIPQMASSGEFVALGATGYTSQRGDHFQKVEVTAKKYLSPTFLSEGHIWSGEIFNGSYYGGWIPLQYLYKIGHNTRVRGYDSGRYRGSSMSSLQFEWKIPLSIFDSDKFLGALFGGSAAVADSNSQISEAQWNSFGGLGLRYLLDPDNKTTLRIDFGVGKKDSAFYFVVGEAI